MKTKKAAAKVGSIKFDGEFWVARIRVGNEEYQAKFEKRPDPSYVLKAWQQDIYGDDFRRV